MKEATFCESCGRCPGVVLSFLGGEAREIIGLHERISTGLNPQLKPGDARCCQMPVTRIFKVLLLRISILMITPI